MAYTDPVLPPSPASTLTNNADAIADNQWRHFHKITPLTQLGALWVLLVGVLISIVQNILDTELLSNVTQFMTLVFHQHNREAMLVLAVSFGVLAIVSVLVVLIAILVWKKQSYALVESGIHYRAGIIVKKHVHMRWDRVQSVEIQRSLFARIFGFGTVKVESAGQDEDLKLGLLTMHDAASLREEVLTTVDRVRSGKLASESFSSAPSPSQTPLMLDIDDAERDIPIYQLTLKKLIVSRVLSVPFIAAVLFLIGSVVGYIDTSLEEEGSFINSWLGVFVLIIGSFWGYVHNMFTDYGTKLFLSANGLRRRSGLTKIATSTYPPQRIHAVYIHRPILWKRLDWWQMTIVKAGSSNDLEEFSRTFVPVATRDEMLRILWVLVPGFGTSNDACVLNEAFNGRGEGEFFASSPRKARWVAPIAWQSSGIALTPHALLIRRGRFKRDVQIVLQDHIQSLRISIGPLDRLLGLGRMTPHLVPGAADALTGHLDVERVWQIMMRENEIAGNARRHGVSESLETWKVRVGL